MSFNAHDEYHSTQQAAPHLAQHDPALQVRPELTGVPWLIVFIVFSSLITGLILYFLPDTRRNPGDVWVATVLLLGIGDLCKLGRSKLERLYWLRRQQQRQQAVQQPAHFLAQTQPQARSEAPQPAQLRWRPWRPATLALNFVVAFVRYFITWLVASSIIDMSLTSNHLWSALIAALLLSILTMVIGWLLIRKAGRQLENRIEITPDGILTYMEGVTTQMRWQDVRTFTTYRNSRLFISILLQRPPVYELASEETVTRWEWPATSALRANGEHKMNNMEYAHWIEDIDGYILERTALPLLDLDAKNKKSELPGI